MRLYLTGPMTGYTNLNFPEFERCTKALRDLGFDVVSPHEIEGSDDWDDCLKADLREMLTCDAIVQMEKWEPSRGSRLETCVAIMVGMTVYKFTEVINGKIKAF